MEPTDDIKTPATRSQAEWEHLFATLPPAPRDIGTVTAIVCRQATGVHEALERVCLSVNDGLPGDAWGRRTPPSVETQLTLMRTDVAELLAQPLTTAGDNFLVELDLAAANLPPGSRLRVGEAIVEVTAKPHLPCQKFARRFGLGAFQFVNTADARRRNLRGLHARVLTGGEVAAGSRIEVLSRPAPIH